MSYFPSNFEKRGKAFCDPSQKLKGRFPEASILKGALKRRFAEGKKKEVDGCGVHHHSRLWSCYELGIHRRLCVLGRAAGSVDSTLNKVLPASLLSVSHANVWVWVCKAPDSRSDVLAVNSLELLSARRGFRWGPSAHCSFPPGWGLPARPWISGVPLNAQSHSALKKQQQARKPLEVGSSWLVWSQLLTLVTDGPLSLPVMQPKWRGGVPSGKPCSARLRESCVQGSVAVRGGGLCVDEAGAPHGLVLLLCPGSGKLPVAEPGMDGLHTSTHAWLGGARS